MALNKDINKLREAHSEYLKIKYIDPYPEFDEYKQYGFKGVSVGYCISDGRKFRRMAHAHNRKNDKYFGWICILSSKRLRMNNGKPSMLMLHELAHILTPNHWHDDTWRKSVRAIGGTINKRYIKKNKR